jgi:hypothetical protein
VLAAVVNEGGAHPERLTLVRKGRGSEHHKGGALIMEGDTQDRCLTTWLSGAVDDTACAPSLARALFDSPRATTSSRSRW